MHPAGLPQFAHAGVDDRITGLPALPARERIARLAPGKSIEGRIEVLFRKSRKVDEQVIRKLPPDDFLSKNLQVAIRDAAAGVFRSLPYPVGRDLAESQMRRQSGGEGPARQVSLVGVAVERFRDEVAKTFIRPRFAGLLRFASSIETLLATLERAPPADPR